MDPFAELIIDKCEARERVSCPGCKTRFKHYCPRCLIALGACPTVKLPIPLTIYRHPDELIGKTTSTHAKILANEMVDLVVSDCSDLEIEDPSRCLLLFPSKDATCLSKIDRNSFDKLVVIDGTWAQAKQMSKRLSNIGFRQVKIQDHETLFWRFQNLNRNYLATIEAIYWFYVAYHEAFVGKYNGQYDNLLYFFKINYNVIQDAYQKSGKPFTKRHALSDSYIQRNSDQDDACLNKTT